MKATFPKQTSIGNILKSERKNLGLLQKECAAKCDYTVRQWQYWESGKHLPSDRAFAVIQRAIPGLKSNAEWLKSFNTIKKYRAENTHHALNNNQIEMMDTADTYRKGAKGKFGFGFIYFLKDESGPIKIGHTTWADFNRRIKVLQCGNPRNLTLIGFLEEKGVKMEASLHSKFSGLKIHGEWFRPEKELTDFIKEHA